MKNLNKIKLVSLIVFLVFYSVLFLEFSLNTDKNCKIDKRNSKIEVNGTSNLHDWETKVTKAEGDLSVKVDEKNNIISYNSVNVNFYSNSFSSGSSGMDSKTTQALKSDKFPVINFNSREISGLSSVNGKRQLHAKGKLTIDGVSRQIEINVIQSEIGPGVVCFEGKQELNMTDFGIVPPVALFGTVKSGNKVSIIFKVYFNY
jgi:polyisoprenoid-binding protein YceI